MLSLLTNDPRSRPTAEEILLRLDGIKDGDKMERHHRGNENDDATNFSPLLECTESFDTDIKSRFFMWFSNLTQIMKVLLLCGLSTLIIVAIGALSFLLLWGMGIIDMSFSENIARTTENTFTTSDLATNTARKNDWEKTSSFTANYSSTTTTTFTSFTTSDTFRTTKEDITSTIGENDRKKGFDLYI